MNFRKYYLRLIYTLMLVAGRLETVLWDHYVRQGTKLLKGGK